MLIRFPIDIYSQYLSIENRITNKEKFAIISAQVMNELIFCFHSIIIVLFLYTALYFGKEAVIACISACWLFANFFISKEIVLFGFEITASDVYAIGGMFGLSLLQEYWGKETARKAVFLSFGLLSFATTASYIHLQYTPSPHDTMHIHYSELLIPQARYLGASFASFLIVQNIEISFFRYLQQQFTLPFVVRACLTAICIQLLDTILFSILGLYGKVHSIVDVIVFSYFIKLITVLITLPFIALSQYLFPKERYAKIPV
jgi:queuosine precursor transporter